MARRCGRAGEGPWGTLFVCPGTRRAGAAHMRPMNLADYIPDAIAALDAEPESRLAISLDSLNHADDRHLIGLDLVKVYLRRADPDTIAPGLAAEIARFRRAGDILRGQVPLGGGLSYRNLRNNIYDLGGSIRDIADDSEARGIVSRILASEPVLGWLVADRQERQGRQA